jgi:hypothetical protein
VGSRQRIRVRRGVYGGGGDSAGTASSGGASIVIPRSKSAFGFSIGNISKALRPPTMTFPRGGARVRGWVYGGALPPPLLRGRIAKRRRTPPPSTASGVLHQGELHAPSSSLSTNLMQQKCDVTMAIMAMAPMHGARVRCNRSRASTAPQGYVVPVHVRVCACRRGWCLGYGLHLTWCGNDHGGAGVCTLASMEGEGAVRRGSPWAHGGWVSVRW